MIERGRFTASAFFFVAALLTSAALIFIFGALGLRGNSTITGGYLLGTVVGVFLLGRRKDGNFAMTLMDKAFAVFAAAVIVACLMHFEKSDYKEYILLTIDSLFAYIAGRALSIPVLSSIRFRLLQISTPVVVTACIATIPHLVGEIYARPFVFGFFHAATAFCIAFGYMVIAYIYSDIEWRSKGSMFFFFLIALATAVFVASTVRFVLIAILITALFALSCSILKPLSIWKRVVIVLLAMTFGVTAGTISRYKFVVTVSDQIANSGAFSGTPMSGQNIVRVERKAQATEAGERPEIAPLSCNTLFDLNNSIAIRRAILNDAFFLLPKAGLFGFGLDSFSRMSCFEGYQVHNSILQALIEFGWIAGLALAILMVIPFKNFLLGIHKFDVNLQFLLSCVAFVTMLSLIYGQPSRDLPLFLFLGAFAKASSLLATADGHRQADIPVSA